MTSSSDRAPDPHRGAWLRRNPVGGWTLSLKGGNGARVEQCDSLTAAGRWIAGHPDVPAVYLWSESRSCFVDLELGSLVPLLEESARAS